MTERRDDEDAALRETALQTARSVFLARQKSDEELVRTRDELHKQSERLRVTLASIGDAVITTDTDGNVLSLNGAASSLTGWAQADAEGRPLSEIFRIIDEDTREPGESPVARVLREGRVVGLASHTVLVTRDGVEIPIDDSAAPIRDESGRTHGVVLVFRGIADRRTAEEAQARLAAIVESSHDAIISKTLDSRIVSWNDAAAQLFGYTAEEAVGQLVTILIPPERQDEEDRILEKLRRGERVDSYETVRVSKDGRRIDVSLTISPVRDGTGRIIGASKIARDVTERRRADGRIQAQHRVTRALAESETLSSAAPRLLESICEHLDWQVGALWCVDEHEHVLRCVDVHRAPVVSIPRFEALTRTRTFERGVGLPGRVWAAAAPLWLADTADDSNFPRAAAARAEGLHGAFAFPITLNDQVLGVLELFSDQGRPPEPPTADILAAIGSQIGQFIERKRAERALRGNEETARFLADASAVLATLTDAESTLRKVATLAVPQFADWCAVDVQAVDGSVRRLTVTMTREARVRHRLDPRGALARFETGPHAVRGVIETGAARWSASLADGPVAGEEPGAHGLGMTSYISVPLRSRNRVLGAFTFATADSARVYDVAHVRAAEDLADRIVIALENSELLVTLRDADRRKDEFLAMLAHELRNPLAPIQNAVHILKSPAASEPEVRRSTEVLERQLHQMTRLVDDLLDVSRITRGTIELRREPVELAAVLANAVEGSRPLIAKRGHHLTLDVPEQPIRLDADPARLAQVLSNLLNNAAKYSDDGGHIDVEAEARGGIATIRVQDDGIGIAPEMLPRIFDLFAQDEAAAERAQGGLGIGLTLVRRLLELHGGSIEARSGGRGKGSVFIVRLPMASAPGAETQRGPAEKQAAAAPGLRILVVDDNRDAAESLQTLLSLSGHEVQLAHDGEEAVSAAAAFRPDVVLLDIGLPRLSGYEVARRLREQEGGGDTLLVAFTGWGQEKDRRLSKEAGFDQHMTKPADLNALMRLLDQAQQRKRPAAPKG